jgi:hypothetical protein
MLDPAYTFLTIAVAVGGQSAANCRLARRPSGTSSRTRPIAEPGKEIGVRRGQEIDRPAPAGLCFGLERGHDGGAHADLAQRWQRHHRTQERVVAVNLEAAEPDGNVLVGLEAPEQDVRIADVVGRQSRLDERGPYAVALPCRKRRGDEAARHVISSSARHPGRVIRQSKG